MPMDMHAFLTGINSWNLSKKPMNQHNRLPENWIFKIKNTQNHWFQLWLYVSSVYSNESCIGCQYGRQRCSSSYIYVCSFSYEMIFAGQNHDVCYCNWKQTQKLVKNSTSEPYMQVYFLVNSAHKSYPVWDIIIIDKPACTSPQWRHSNNKAVSSKHIRHHWHQHQDRRRIQKESCDQALAL